jgi:putative FmdB family regulatory protein
MPTYAYHCAQCSKAFDLLRPVECRDDTRVCPDCTGPADRTIRALGGFDLCGNGWYQKGNAR